MVPLVLNGQQMPLNQVSPNPSPPAFDNIEKGITRPSPLPCHLKIEKVYLLITCILLREVACRVRMRYVIVIRKSKYPRNENQC